MTNKLKKEKTKGWANLQRQLEEVREESFKQGVWKGRENQKQEDDERFEEFIKRLKEYLITSAGQSKLLKQDRNLIFNFIDKLAEELKGEQKQ